MRTIFVTSSKTHIRENRRGNQNWTA